MPPNSPILRNRQSAVLVRVSLAVVAGAVSLAPCATAGAAPKPPAGLTPPPAYAAAPAPGDALAPADGFDWVAAFAAPALQEVVNEALKANPQLRQAEARADAQRARARAAAGRWLPDVSIGLTGTRIGVPTPAPTGLRTQTESVGSRADASWEADVWGRVLDGVRAEGAEARAADADLAAARLATAGRAASGWVDLVEAAQLSALADEDLATRTRAETITQRRYEAGLSDALALRTARAQSASARAQLAAQKDQSLRAARQLEATLGRYPAGAAQAGGDFPKLGAISAPGAPIDLIAQRPDVAAAEARLQAAGLRVWQARKALAPRLTLNASAIGSGIGLRDVTDIDGLVTQIVAGLTMPIFQGGALRADVRAARAQARAAAASYVETTISAWREVEDALSADASLARRETELAAAAVEAREAQALAEREYARGVATIFELIDSYSRRIDAERSLISVRAQRVNTRISYHLALGDLTPAMRGPRRQGA